MSGLARYFRSRGYRVSGYDRTPSPLTHQLEEEGMTIGYEDRVDWLQSLGLDRLTTVVVRTPAVPEDNLIYTSMRADGYAIHKRAEVLGLVTQQMKALCVAGTHGKTTTSTMLAHLLHTSHIGTNAFLGGISMNYGTNVLIEPKSDYVVVEADEYDRSFHRLQPNMSIVTAVDADHLDIYGTEEAYREAFAHYTSLISEALVMKHGIALQPRLQKGVKLYTYGIQEDRKTGMPKEYPDFYADNIRVADGQIAFDFHTPAGTIASMTLGVPVWVNIENAVAAMAVAWLNGVTEDELRAGLASFAGVQRRFNIHVNTARVAYIDDYAHHPEEIATAIDSIRRVFPNRRLIGVFQPHLYTRTRDFADDFARVLSTLDEVVLLPIYPARELPIAGVDSEMLLSKITNPNKRIVDKPALVDYLKGRKDEGAVVLTVGAGDIDRLVPDITAALR